MRVIGCACQEDRCLVVNVVMQTAVNRPLSSLVGKTDQYMFRNRRELARRLGFVGERFGTFDPLFDTRDLRREVNQLCFEGELSLVENIRGGNEIVALPLKNRRVFLPLLRTACRDERR